MRACVRACVRARARVCVCVCVQVPPQRSKCSVVFTASIVFVMLSDD